MLSPFRELLPAHASLTISFHSCSAFLQANFRRWRAHKRKACVCGAQHPLPSLLFGAVVGFSRLDRAGQVAADYFRNRRHFKISIICSIKAMIILARRCLQGDIIKHDYEHASSEYLPYPWRAAAIFSGLIHHHRRYKHRWWAPMIPQKIRPADFSFALIEKSNYECKRRWLSRRIPKSYLPAIIAHLQADER